MQTLNGFKSFSSTWLLKFCFCFFLLIQTYHIIFLTSPWNNLYNNIIWVLIRSNRTLNWPQPFLSVFAVCIDSNLCRVPPAAIISHLAPAREYRHNIDTTDSPPFPHSTPGLSLYHRCIKTVTTFIMESKSPPSCLFSSLRWPDVPMVGPGAWKILVIWVGGCHG